MRRDHGERASAARRHCRRQPAARNLPSRAKGDAALPADATPPLPIPSVRRSMGMLQVAPRRPGLGLPLQYLPALCRCRRWTPLVDLRFVGARVGAFARSIFDGGSSATRASRRCAAALIGSLREESHLIARQHELGGGKGRGIAQSSVNERWQNLLDWAHDKHKSPTSFAVQLQFVWHELTTGYRGVLDLLRHAHHDLRGVTTRVAAEYEMAGTVRPDARIRCARRTLHHPRGRPGGEC
jgi:hypothetical protein